MPSFKEILPTLRPIDGIASLTLAGTNGDAVLENKPGTSGSVAVYHEVSFDTGRIDAESAEKALALYAEHTADARENPGKHPNIDRLFALIENGEELTVTVNPPTAAQS
ncbi:MAG: DUF2322 family protein [bacterium]